MCLLALAFVAVLPVMPTYAESLGSWTSTTNFPESVDSISCVTWQSYEYCVAGSSVFYAPISSSGVGAWTVTTSYPINSLEDSCASSGGYIYCIAGYTGGSSPQSATYYAPISSSGVGTWVQTTSYPIRAEGLSCATANGYIYCVGGDEAVGTLQTASVYYAPVSSSGIGTWTATTSYPITISGESCVTNTNYIYCTSGVTALGPSVMNSTYYAPISSSGVGAWIQTTNYPTYDQDQSCVQLNSYIYCIGGLAALANGGYSTTNAVYYAPISSNGVGAWTSTANYPISIELLSCVAASGYIYCTAGYTGSSHVTSVYYASIAPPATSMLTVNSEQVNGSSLSGMYTVLYSSSNVVGTEFTPTAFTLNNGQSYTVQVDDYGSCHFDHWADTGSASVTRGISISSNTQLTAVYNCGTTTLASSVIINSVDQNGASISGFYTVLYDSSNSLVATGFTPKTFATTAGLTYSIEADSYGSYTFCKWSDGNTINPRPFTASSSALTFTAVYNCVVSPPSGESIITVTTINSAGSTIPGYYIALYENGAQIASCFSTCSFNVDNGQTYQVGAASYGSETFSHWQNDGSTGLETVAVPSTSTIINLTAVYSP